MSTSERLVVQLVAEIYASSIREFRHIDPDMSRSNKCHTLTLDLFRALQKKGITVRRELHETPDGFWHYVINHSLTPKPSGRDIITDLNPWDFPGSEPHTGFLHGARDHIQKKLLAAGADIEYVALRGVATITAIHSEKLTPLKPIRRQK